LIEPVSSNFDKMFDNLKPVSYQLINGSSNRRHTGFIAQQVVQSLQDAGIDTKDFAGVCIPKDENTYYSLRYEEFIALCVDQIQKLKKRVGELETQLIEIKGE
jgi:hypothetical protein